ncbi:hypothetical protein DUZ16_06505 [Campylobacter jejuni]|nr:hypothetical protein [Campylobacter jejuni]EDO9415773.1 hypothetical protein [Campylobacter coli]EAL9138420.1 hypothetical protein [Campylobacter jejuni]EDP2938671.1 hypothetical protein [Campylobacter jejuni]EFS3668839.1 hypothetical protein [Campylobacter jejuni]
MTKFLKDLIPFDERRTRFILYCDMQGISLNKKINNSNKRLMYVLDLETFNKVKESYKNYKKRGCYVKSGRLMDLALKDIENNLKEKDKKCLN